MIIIVIIIIRRTLCVCASALQTEMVQGAPGTGTAKQLCKYRVQLKYTQMKYEWQSNAKRTPFKCVRK